MFISCKASSSCSQMMVITLVGALMFAVCSCNAQTDGTVLDTEDNHPIEILDIETPTSYDFTSPLKEGSLKDQPYLDFLSTLYKKDDSKANLFTNLHS